jgi:hypothetical protein
MRMQGWRERTKRRILFIIKNLNPLNAQQGDKARTSALRNKKRHKSAFITSIHDFLELKLPITAKSDGLEKLSLY